MGAYFRPTGLDEALSLLARPAAGPPPLVLAGGTDLYPARVGRPIDEEAVDTIAADIEDRMRALGPEVSSEMVGLAVLEHLKALDHVAYLRFASVYKGFEDLADFEREVGLLQKTTAPKPRRARNRH